MSTKGNAGGVFRLPRSRGITDHQEPLAHSCFRRLPVSVDVEALGIDLRQEGKRVGIFDGWRGLRLTSRGAQLFPTIGTEPAGTNWSEPLNFRKPRGRAA